MQRFKNPKKIQCFIWKSCRVFLLSLLFSSSSRKPVCSSFHFLCLCYASPTEFQVPFLSLNSSFFANCIWVLHFFSHFLTITCGFINFPNCKFGQSATVQIKRVLHLHTMKCYFKSCLLTTNTTRWHNASHDCCFKT